jgi:hypothetical protein
LEYESYLNTRIVDLACVVPTNAWQRLCGGDGIFRVRTQVRIRQNTLEIQSSGRGIEFYEVIPGKQVKKQGSETDFNFPSRVRGKPKKLQTTEVHIRKNPEKMQCFRGDGTWLPGRVRTYLRYLPVYS